MKTKCSPRGQSPKPTLSAAKLAANRQNARKSTGPRTPEGKTRASRNARKHGLAAAAGEPDRLEKISVLAAALAEGSTDWDVRAYAHSVAEAQLDLERVREARMLEHEAAGPGFSSKERSPAGWTLRLSRLERYERRAFSRRQRAIRGLEAAKVGARPGSPLVELGRRVVAEFWQNEASGAGCDTSGETGQNEASGTVGDVWHNEPTKARSERLQNKATEVHAQGQQNEPSGAARNSSTEIRQDEPKVATAEDRQSEATELPREKLQNEATVSGVTEAAPKASRPEGVSEPRAATGEPATLSGCLPFGGTAPRSARSSARGARSGASATGPPRPRG